MEVLSVQAQLIHPNSKNWYGDLGIFESANEIHTV